MIDLTNQIESLKDEIKHLSHEMVRLTTTTEQHLIERRDYTTKLDKLDKEFTRLQGVMATLKTLLGFTVACGITFATWVVTSNHDHQKEINTLQQKITYLEKNQ